VGAEANSKQTAVKGGRGPAQESEAKGGWRALDLSGGEGGGPHSSVTPKKMALVSKKKGKGKWGSGTGWRRAQARRNEPT